MPWLEWMGRKADLGASGRVPYRLLEAVPSLDCGAPDAENLLIQGDNLDALKALLPYYAGQVKCIFIDPPYNTKSAFEHYNDNLEHSQWLSMMYPRLLLLRELLHQQGSIWITIDDNEAHYLKVVCDEVFGRENFVAGVVWQKTTSARNDAEFFSADHDYVLVYARSLRAFKVNGLDRGESADAAYKNPDNDPRGPWREIDYKCAKSADERPNLYYAIRHPVTGLEVWPRRSRVWAYGQQEHARHLQENLLWWGRTGNYSLPKLKKFLTDASASVVPRTLWFAADVDQTRTAKKEMKDLNPDDPFGTPKPERLLARILQIATDPGDLVLDSFLGSGTTAAVAHKMGRRWIGVEIGEHAETHCLPRLRKVVDGEQGGISESVGWQGGGGFRFFRLGPTVFDESGRLRTDIKFGPLAAHVWFSETGHVLPTLRKRSPLLGVHEGTAYYLLYNGILGDKRPDAGNVLTLRVLADLPVHDGPRVIYGESCRLSPDRLESLGVRFQQIPYELRARG